MSRASKADRVEGFSQDPNRTSATGEMGGSGNPRNGRSFAILDTKNGIWKLLKSPATNTT
jgi:hypothetical protein